MPQGGPNASNPSNSGLCIMALSMDSIINGTSSMTLFSVMSRPIKAWRKPMMTTTSSAKKIMDSFIMTLRTTSMAPKKRKLSR